jgi:protein-S-isoprenylcysteine O-methyltransferase Ste14
MRLLLALRALFFVLLLPGTVAVYIPFSILRAGNLLHVPDLELASVCAAVFAITGALILLRCVWDFFAAGKGTLAPIDPPRFLVVRALYRFTRNPMYNGVIALILGEAWLFKRAPGAPPNMPLQLTVTRPASASTRSRARASS